jgi:hypothetical protein
LAYVCETLSSPAFLTGQQTCTKWVVQQNTSFLPDLSAADKDILLLWMLSIFIVVFTVKQIKRLFAS